MYDTMGTMPASIFRATNEQKIEIFAGGKMGGYVNGSKTIHLKKGIFEAIRHEQGHELDGADCPNNAVDTEFIALNPGPDAYQTPGIGLTDYRQAHDQEVVDIVEYTEEDFSPTVGYNDAIAKVDADHPDEAGRIAFASGQPGSVVEDKAEIYKFIMTGNRLSEMLAGTRPVIAAKTRLLLARMFHRDPKATEYFISRNYVFDPADQPDIREQLTGR